MDHLSNDPYSLLIPAFLDVRRTSPRDCKDRHLRVILSGQLLDHIYYGERKLFPIRPGRYTLTATNTLNRKSIDFEIKSGETLYFECGHRARDITYIMACVLGTGWLWTFLEPAGPAAGSKTGLEDPIVRELSERPE